MVKWATLRILFALASECRWYVHQIDVKTAYLNGSLKQEIFKHQLKGFIKDTEKHLVCKLNKSLYGLKQSGRQWFHCLDQYLKEINFIPTVFDPCTYKKSVNKNILIITVYVDDLLIFGDNLLEIENTKKLLSKRFEMKYLKEVNLLLGAIYMLIHKTMILLSNK